MNHTSRYPHPCIFSFHGDSGFRHLFCFSQGNISKLDAHRGWKSAYTVGLDFFGTLLPSDEEAEDEKEQMEGGLAIPVTAAISGEVQT